MRESIFKNKKFLFGTIAGVLIIVIVLSVCLNNKKPEEISEEEKLHGVKSKISIMEQSDDRIVDIEAIVQENEKQIITEKIEMAETAVEYTTQYRENNSLASGKIQTIQNGKAGKQNSIMRVTYQNGELISRTQISSEITLASVDKIVEIGTGSISNTYVPISGDTMVTVKNGVKVKVTPEDESQAIDTLSAGKEVTFTQRQGIWDYVSYDEHVGWIKDEDLQYVNPNGDGDGDENRRTYTREQLTQNVGFSMLLNRPSYLTLEQFRKIFADDEHDRNHVFSHIADYFYYVEQEYGINGLFVAAVGIHESGWGTSAISLDKKNLFGYGAYDSDPYGYASDFSSYSTGIDLVSRVFMKYYLNPKGTVIYNNEIAEGTYYNGSTLTAVNKCYATDKNWANAVYNWMQYLYNKI